jgi:hypothetical protein
MEFWSYSISTNREWPCFECKEPVLAWLMERFPYLGLDSKPDKSDLFKIDSPGSISCFTR